MFEFKLDNKPVNKGEFLVETDNKPITIERVGKLFDNKRFKRVQFILHVSCDEAEIESKIYISPVVKNKEDELLYFGDKSFIHPLLSYALTARIVQRGITVPYSTVKEVLEDNIFTLQYDFSGKYPTIKGVE